MTKSSRPSIQNGSWIASQILRAILAASSSARDPGHEQRELVAAEARHRVALADVLLDPLGHLAQQLVADRVAERVVDDLEAVEVEEEDGQPLVVAVGLRHGERQAVVEEEAVGQVRQRVVEGEVLDLLLGPLALA